MQKKNFRTQHLYSLVLLTIILLVTGTALTPGIVIAETEENDNGNVDYELVQGYFTEISYSGPQQTSIELTHQEENFTYTWSHSNNEWRGDTEYLHEEDTHYSDGDWSLKIAVDHDAPTDENWIMIIDEDEHDVRVAEAETGLGKSGSLNFHLEPHTEEAVASDSFRLVNTGNVPGTFELSHDIENLEVFVDDEIVEPGGSESITFEFTHNTADPEIFSLDEIDIRVYSLGRLDLEAEGNVRVESEIGYSETPTVTVGYEGFEHEEGIGYSIQFEESIEVVGDTANEVTFYVYPEEEIYINFDKENVTFDEEDVTIIGRGGEEETLDFDPTEPISPDYNEVQINVNFTADHQEDGWIEISLRDGTEPETYLVEIELTETVDPPEDDDNGAPTQDRQFYFGALIIGAVIVFYVVRSGFWKKEEEKEEEDE